MAGMKFTFSLLVCAAAALMASGTLSELDLALLPQRPEQQTTRGNEFFFAFMGNDRVQSPVEQDTIIIVTTEEPNPVQVTVEVNPVFYTNNPQLDATVFPRVQTQTVARGSSITFRFANAVQTGATPPDNDIRVYTIESSLDRNSGIRISTDGGEISVYGLNNELSSVDAFSIFPCHEYSAIIRDYEYVILSAAHEDRNSRLMIVGCQDDTEVTITPPSQLPSIGISVPPNLGGGQTPRPAVPLVIADLDQLTSIVLNNLDDLSGTRISSNRPIAVFAGHECANVPTVFVESCDHIIQQVPPTLTWGRLFFTVPITARYSGDHYRVATATADTHFNLTCRTLTNPTPTTEFVSIMFNTLTGSGFAMFDTNRGTTGTIATRKEDLQWCCIESNNPVLVMQYAHGNTADAALKDPLSSTLGDPFMTIVPPVVQYLNDYTAPTEIGLRESTFIVGYTIAVPRDDTFFRSPTEDGSRILLNNDAIIPDPDEGWIEIFCSNGQICGYSARVEHAPDGVITIRHVVPQAALSAWVYGIAGAVSFGFTAGFKLDAVAFPVVSAENVTVMETDGVAVVTFTRTGDLSSSSRFIVRLTPGSATSSADYDADYAVNPTNAVFDATTNEFEMRSNVATVNVTFNITMDTIPEATENFFLFLEGTRRVFILTPVISITILDDLPPPIDIGFEQTLYIVNEASGAVTMSIIKRGNTSEPITVDFITQSGTAVDRLDFTSTFLTVTFEPSETDEIVTVTVPINPDDLLEITESFCGLLFNAMGSSVSIDSPIAMINIIDDDRVLVGFDPEVYDVLETNAVVTLTIRKFTPSAANVSVMFSTLNGTAMAPGDFGELQSQVIFRPNEEIQTVQVSIVDSTTAEGQEFFFGHLLGEVGEPVDVANNATINIINVALVDFESLSYTANEEDEKVDFRIVKRTQTFEDITVLFSTDVSDQNPATSNFDYAAVSNRQVMIAANEDSVIVTVTILNDVIAENMERFSVSLTLPDASSGVVLNVSSAVAVIVDNDCVIVELESRSHTVEENTLTGDAELVVMKSGINEANVTIDVNISPGLAQAGVDFNDVNRITLTFRPCVSATMTVRIPIIDDDIAEPTECFEVSLVAGAAAGPKVLIGDVGNACVQILDDDAGRNQPPYPPVGEKVEVEYENRVMMLGQNPELLEFAHEFKETIVINLTMPINNPEIFREGSNYAINCQPWLLNFTGGSIQWYQSLIDPITGVRMATDAINVTSPPPSINVSNSQIFITSTLVTPIQQQSTAAIYTCEVCINREGNLIVDEVCADVQCHNASVVTFNIGSPPIIDDTTPVDISFVETGGIREFRVGSSPCLSNPPDITPPAQGEPSPDPEIELRIRCDLENAQLTETSENPRATPSPITRTWYFNGDLIYEAILDSTPQVNENITNMFPAIVFANQGWIAIQTDIEDIFANRTDNATFGDVFGNWTCSLSNPLGTDTARFGTILRECGEPVLPTKEPDNRVEVVSGGIVQIGCIGCVVIPPDDPEVSIDCTPVAGNNPFVYTWFTRENDTDILLEERSSTLNVTEEGEYICQVSNNDRLFPATSTTMIRFVPVNLFATITDELGETLTDNGCSRFSISPDPGNDTFCTLIGDTLNINCSSESPGQEVLVLTPEGDEIKRNSSVSFSVSITRMSNGTYSCVVMDDLCDMIGPRISVDTFVTMSPQPTVEPTPGVPTDPERPAATNTGTIIAVVVASAVFIVVVAIVITTVCIFCLRRKQKTKKFAVHSTQEDISLERNDKVDSLALHYQGTPTLASTELKSLPRSLIIPAIQLQLKDTLGQGEFGIVYKAFLKRYVNSETEIVAVKTLKGLFTSKDVHGLVEEVLKMEAFQHSHVISLIGVCLDSGAGPAIVMPYMANGSLLDYLRKERDDLLLDERASPNKVSETQKLLLNICLQIAEGMEYLAREKVVHRDLSARNCMIDAEGIIKVADFGLSVDIYSTNYYRQGKEQQEMKLPIRWMAVESIMDGIYTEKSDVWSFGVTVWEVYSGGKLPYPGVASPALIRHVESGGRLSKPENPACSDEVYSCMQQCWLEVVDRRPNFHDLVTTISNILESTAGYLGLQRSVSLIKRVKQDRARSPRPKGKISEIPILEEGEEEEDLEGTEKAEKEAEPVSECGRGEGVKESEKKMPVPKPSGVE